LDDIVVTSSSNAIATTQGRSAYTAAKRGLVGLVQSASLDYVAKNIRINTLIPGTTDTPLVRRVAGMENVPDSVWQLAAAEWAKSHSRNFGPELLDEVIQVVVPAAKAAQ
jgi:NAD(P)-dependent dehydrogenase (short-subunit alcohol dehydrogenase family)